MDVLQVLFELSFLFVPEVAQGAEETRFNPALVFQVSYEKSSALITASALFPTERPQRV